MSLFIENRPCINDPVDVLSQVLLLWGFHGSIGRCKGVWFSNQTCTVSKDLPKFDFNGKNICTKEALACIFYDISPSCASVMYILPQLLLRGNPTLFL